MTYTQQQLADLRSAIAEGVTKVRFSDGRELTYRSLDEMRRIETAMAADLETTQNIGTRKHYFTPMRMS